MTCKRAYPRLEIESPITYMLYTPDDRVVRFGAAIVCNISRGGMMIETREPIDSDRIKVAIAVVGENDQVILGKVIHCRDAGDGRFYTGIKFLASDPNRRLAAAALLKIHNLQKHSAPIDQAH